MVKNFGQII